MQQRTQSCVRTAGDIVSTALGIIQYWEGTPPRVLISVLLIQNIPRKKSVVSRNILSQNIPRKKNQNAPPSEIAYATLWDSGVDYLPPPGGRLVAHGQSVYPCHENGIQFGPYLTTALDDVGCDVSLSWVGLGWVMSVLLIQNIPRRKNQNAPPSEIAYATLWDSGVDYLPPARWPVGSPRPERLPMPRGRYSIRSVFNDVAR